MKAEEKTLSRVLLMFVVCDLTMEWLSFSLFLRLVHWMGCRSCFEVCMVTQSGLLPTIQGG